MIREESVTERRGLPPAPSGWRAYRRRTRGPAAGRTPTGQLRDYGSVQANVAALAAGIPDAASAHAILDWLDGVRIVTSDTSTGTDLYVNRFGPRFTTLKNDLDYVWSWTGYPQPWGGWPEDGGASLLGTFLDVQARLRWSDVGGARAVWTRTLDRHKTVREFGAVGGNFYRTYYAAHPELGSLAVCGTPGGIGLDRDFIENVLAPEAWVNSWLAIETSEPGVLRIAPSLPPALRSLGARSVVYRFASASTGTRSPEVPDG